MDVLKLVQGNRRLAFLRQGVIELTLQPANLRPQLRDPLIPVLLQYFDLEGVRVQL